MPSPIPPRDRDVYFVGAGLSSAFKIPNTPALINEVLRFASSAAGDWLHNTEHVEDKLKKAFLFFYPDARHAGFQPDVVDFFSTLQSYLDVGAGLVGTGFADAPDLFRLLQRGIAHLLIHRTRGIDEEALQRHPYLEEMVKPGNIIITSNWDTLIEHYAQLRKIPLRLTSRSRHFDTNEVYLLKLHGSLDWCQVGARVADYADDDYATLQERRYAARTRRSQLPTRSWELIRIRGELQEQWRTVKSRSREPWMVTMGTGKSDQLKPLREVWRDAYRALSRAQRLEIVGYSMPPDDVEIRTILRTGIQRGASGTNALKVHVRNPAPDVHFRIRAFLDRMAVSDYQAIPPPV